MNKMYKYYLSKKNVLFDVSKRVETTNFLVTFCIFRV